MARTFGTIVYDGKDDLYRIRCEPQVVLRLKRVFERISKAQHGTVSMAANQSNARELLWFMERYPLEVDSTTLRGLRKLAAEHRKHEEQVATLLAPDYEPTRFNLVVPPRKYQCVAADLLLERGNLLLADQLGIGKTASAICALCDPRTLPALVVTMTHLPGQWKKELEKFAPALRVHVLRSGTPYELEGRRERGPNGKFQTLPFPDVIVTSYSKLSNGWPEVLAGKVKYLVMDECQELRTGPKTNTSGSNRYDGVKFVADAAAFRCGLSATPIHNYGGEFYNLFEVLAPGALGTHDEFVREWCRGNNGGGRASKIDDPKAFGMYLREQGLMLLRTRAEVGRELPPLQMIPHHIEANLDAIEKIATSAGELARVILAQGGRGIDKLRAGEDLDYKLRQATGCAKAPYVAEFVRILIESGEPVLLYSWHHEVYALLADRLKDLKPAFYTGKESPKEKDEAKERFLSGDTDLLIMSLRAGAGLDGLQARARVVVFGELDWSPGVLDQCLGRLHRDGQTEPVMGYILMADHGSDPVMADVLGLKRAQITGVLDPMAALVERTDAKTGHVKRLAEAFLRQQRLLPAREDNISFGNDKPCNDGKGDRPVRGLA
jgi:SNF2 family DNA or RNA helicase